MTKVLILPMEINGKEVRVNFQDNKVMDVITGGLYGMVTNMK